MRTSLIITTYNWPRALDLCLASVAKQKQMPDEIVVADDGSGPQTAEVIQSWSTKLAGGIRHIWQEDLGFRLARSRNRAIVAAEGDYIVLIDGDMILHPSFVADHVACAKRGCFIQGARPGLSATQTERFLRDGITEVSPWIPDLDRRAYALRSAILSKLTSKTRASLGGVQGCNQSFWRSDFLTVNGYDERFTDWGPEDREFAARLLNIGVQRLYLRHRAIALHLHHCPRAAPGANPFDHLLAHTIASRRTRCEDGADKHFQELRSPLQLSKLARASVGG